MYVHHVGELLTFSVAADGRTVSLGMADEERNSITLVLPAKLLQAFVMTLPEMAQQALRRKNDDPDLRLVFPVVEWKLEKAVESQRLILTLTTTDGFSASFGIDVREMARMTLAVFGDHIELATDENSEQRRGRDRPN